MSADLTYSHIPVARHGWCVLVPRRLISMEANRKSVQGMEALIADACKRTVTEIRQGQFELSGPGGRIILPRIWEATLQPGWTITIHFHQARNEELQQANRADFVAEYRLDSIHLDRRLVSERDRWTRDREQERERWEAERVRERERWEGERQAEKTRWEGWQEGIRQRWEIGQVVSREDWQRERERNAEQEMARRREWETRQERQWERYLDRNQARQHVMNPERELNSSATHPPMVDISPCLLWLAGRCPRRRKRL